MTCKHLFTCLILLFSQLLISQKITIDQSTYIVEWAQEVDRNDKTNYLNRLNSTMLCEFEFGGKQYAWLEFLTFPFDVGEETIININGGVTPAQSQPEVDNFLFDYKAELSEKSSTVTIDCHPSFDLQVPVGPYPVTIFNLDTGVNLPICDNSNQYYDFCGPTNCSIDYTFATGECVDFNGHGTHGLGIQQHIINKSLYEYSGNNVINIENFTVFNGNGRGNLGAILCALSDVLSDPSPRKVVNCSFSFYKQWNGQDADPLFDAFVDLGNANILSVTSAGNKSMSLDRELKSYPACYFSEDLEQYGEIKNSTICIGAATCAKETAKYSNYSTENVDISTLGNILGPDNESGLIEYKGTSQATFASSAITALLMSHQENVDISKLKCSIISGATKLNEFSSTNKAGGILSGVGAYEALISGTNCANTTSQFPKFASSDSQSDFVIHKSDKIEPSVFPNPVITNFSYSVNVLSKGQYILSMSSTAGNLLHQVSLTLKKGQNLIEFDNQLESGTYFIHLEGSGIIKNSKFVKQ